MANYLIIGGSSGIGRALTLKLANEGNNVWATYNTHIQENSNNINYHHLNVWDDNLDLSFLPDTIDGLCYCVGAIHLKPFNRLNAADFANDYALQVIGAVKTIQACLPKLKNSEIGSLVLFSTVAVQTGMSFHAQVSSTKGAIEGLTKALAAEFAPKLRVNCIAPSLTNTPLAAQLLSSEEKLQAISQKHPLKRIGNAEDVAELAAFLLDGKSSWMTGQILHLDGGMSTLKP
jgi:NAD(P)-dependent dehydrogenase (short-subunit alcohol dehydrogenase family)